MLDNKKAGSGMDNDRGATSVNSGWKKNGRVLKYLAMLAFAAVVIGVMALLFSVFVLKKEPPKQDPEQDKRGSVKQTLPSRTFQPPTPVAAEKNGKDSRGGKADSKKSDIRIVGGKEGEKLLPPMEQLRADRYESALSPKAEGSGGLLNFLGSKQGPIEKIMAGGRSSGPLGGMLNSTATPPRSASIIKNRSLTLAKGAMIPCVLKTRIDSTVPGMTSCVLPHNLYSDDGKTVLAERGSEIVGEYQSELKQGQARLFVLWTRIKTTKGVLINLDSTGTDPLGGSGMPGYVDNHFLERFGGAILLSVITDSLQTGTQVAQEMASKSSGGGSSVVYSTSSGNAQSMAAEALRNTINIPPTLYKNQGDRISIFVARDLSFESIYEIRPL
jgi:type IV secretion system protein VirB10